MSQFFLFPSASNTLLNDARGCVTYEPDFIDDATADRWFGFLRDTLDWKSERRQMYDREVDVPRLRAHFSSEDDLPEPIADALSRVTGRVEAPFNSIGLNFYRDHNDSVAPHNDTLDMLVPDQPIALLSLGATRRMVIRQKAAPHRRLQVDMHAGSLMVMSFATQLHYDHGIPKERVASGPRISLAFRVHK